MIEAHLQAAWEAIQKQKWSKADTLLAPYPNLAPALHLKGLLSYSQGHIEEALVHWQRALQQGGLVEIHCLLAQAYMDLNQMAKVIEAYEQAQSAGIELTNSQRHQLARANFAQAQFDKALTLYKDLGESYPKHAGLALELGNTYAELRDYSTAKEIYQEALALDPHSELILFSLARLAFLTEDLTSANDYAQKSLEQNPKFVPAWHLLGSLQQRSGQIQAACLSFEQACELAPIDPQSWNHLGLCYQVLYQAPKAQKAYHKALELKPDFIEAKINLAMSLREDNQSEAALDLLRSIHSFQSLYLQACTLPIILQEAEDSSLWQKHLTESLDHCLESAQKKMIRIQDPLQELGRLPFYLPYLGIQDLPILQKLSELWQVICPDLNWQSPHIQAKRSQGRWRIGLFSAHFYQHTVTELFGYLFAELDRSRFEIIGFYWGNTDDQRHYELTKHADQMIVLPTDLKQARELVSGVELDLALYLDIGMDPFGYFLAHARLARRQLVTWGHPISSGLKSIDAYLSCPELELEPEQNYCEPLLLVPAFFGNWQLPALPDKTRADFALPVGKLYLCPQSLYKIHPEMNALFAGILERDPQAYLVMIEGSFTSWQDALQKRWAGKLELKRVIWLPRLSNQDFLCVLKLVDVILDTRPFGGGLTSLQAFSVGTPVISWPTNQAKGRFTQVIAHHINWTDGIVDSAEDYIQCAIRLAAQWSSIQRLELQSRFQMALLPKQMALQLGQTLNDYLNQTLPSTD